MSDEVLDKFNDTYFPGWREREANRPAPIPHVGVAQSRQLDELRGLVLDALRLLDADENYNNGPDIIDRDGYYYVPNTPGFMVFQGAWDHDRVDWLWRAREATK